MKVKKIRLPFEVKKGILALGSQTKNTICFAKDGFAYLSPTHADLSHLPDFLEFEKDAKYFLRKKPKMIALDLHPDYQSSLYAQDLLRATSYELRTVQHHHAHIASCMVDNGLANQKVIGVAFDGTGLGMESQLWGGEFLICDYKNFKRRVHIKEIPLLGGEKAIQEPWRLTVAWLYQIYKDKFLNLNIDFVKGLDIMDWRVLKQMYLSGTHAPLASSAGRLFDAVASLVLNKHKVRFEAELAIQLEKLAAARNLQAAAYPFELKKDKFEYILNPLAMFKQITLDLKQKESREKIAYRFHFTVAQMIRKSCLYLRKENRINKVVLSGGVFQNRLLLEMASDLLGIEGFKIFTHRQLSASDINISLGQVAVAHSRS
jgi:hydrogenase maturation protein HypF